MPVSLQIPDPCSERWSAMAPAGPNCRHCVSCEKQIVDFTNAGDAEILAYLERSGKICGRFRPEQMNRPLQPSGRRARRTGLSALTAGFAAILSAKQPHETVNPSPEALENPVLNRFPATTPVSPAADSTPSDSVRTVSGKIISEDNEEPVIGASISLKGTNCGTFSDVNGVFNLSFPVGLTRQKTPLILEINYTGYSHQEIILPDRVRTDDLAILPHPLTFADQMLLGEVVVTSRRQRFWAGVRRFFR